MSPNLAKRSDVRIVRPLKVLVPLIKVELEAGERAGLEHYRQAGELLIEAKDQMPYGSWERWLAQNFKRADGKLLHPDTARYYMRLARKLQESSSGPRTGTESVRSIIDRPDTTVSASAAWRPAIKAARDLDADLFAQEQQTQDEEVRLHRELATELVDIGYKALATRLHPDRGGSKDAMVRLNRIREVLTTFAKTRRFV